MFGISRSDPRKQNTATFYGTGYNRVSLERISFKCGVPQASNYSV